MRTPLVVEAMIAAERRENWVQREKLLVKLVIQHLKLCRDVNGGIFARCQRLRCLFAGSYDQQSDHKM